LIASGLHFPSTIIVLSFEQITFSAFQRNAISTSSSLYPNSGVIKVAHVTAEISNNISFFLSPNPGALIATTFNTHLILFKTNEAKASHSTSSAIITISFFHVAATDSNIFMISFIELIFWSVNKI
jgi:hypothetical protein